MSQNDFVHLHVHSQYSLLEASIRPDQLVKKTSDFKQSAVALTDNGNMFGAVEFYFAAKEQSVKAILGTDVFLAPKSRFQKGEDKETLNQPNRRLVLLAQNTFADTDFSEVMEQGCIAQLANLDV